MPTIERQLLLVAEEATYNTTPTPVAADALLVLDPVYKANPTIYKRGTASNLSRPMRPNFIGSKKPQLTFVQELTGNPAAFTDSVNPLCDLLWRSCGFKMVSSGSDLIKTYTWDPAAVVAPCTTAPSVWFQLESDGHNQVMGGSRGNFDMELVPGEKVKVSYQYEGMYQPHAVAAMTVPVYVESKPMLVESCALAPFSANMPLGGIGRITKATLNLRNQVYRATDVNGTNGCSDIAILGRGTPPEDMGSTLTLEVVRPLNTADPTWWDHFLDATVGATCSITLIGHDAQTPSKAQTLVITFGQLMVDSLEDTKIDGMFGYKVVCRILGASGSVAEDDLKMVWTQSA